uniref:CCHC-type domain-containing protein n=1 Tax=Tetranychus urticae TaxID=32264 RepID=T1L5C5_TETUR
MIYMINQLLEEKLLRNRVTYAKSMVTRKSEDEKMPDNLEIEFSRQITKLDGFLQDTCTGNTKEETKNLVDTYKSTELDEYKAIILKIKSADPKTVPISESTTKDLEFFLEAVKWEFPEHLLFKPKDVQKSTVPTEISSQKADYSEGEYHGLETFLEQVCAGKNETEIRQLVSVQFQQDISFFHQMISKLTLPVNAEIKKKLPEATIKNIDTLVSIQDWQLVVKESSSKDKPEMAFSKDLPLINDDIKTLKQFMNKTMGNRLPTTTQLLVKNWDRKEIKNIRNIITKILYDTSSVLPEECTADIIEKVNKFMETVKWRLKGSTNDDSRKRPQASKPDNPIDFKKAREQTVGQQLSNDNPNARPFFIDTNASQIVQDKDDNEPDTSLSLREFSFQTQPLGDHESSFFEKSSSITDDLNASLEIAKPSTRENKIYCIKKALNTRKQWAPNPDSHVVKWISVNPVGYGVYIHGPEYRQNCVKEILLNTKKTFGEFKRFHQDEKYTLLVMTTKQGRDVILDIINNDIKGLVGEIATHRYPQIKFSVHQSQITDPKLMVKQIHMFNFKEFQKHKFELCGTHRTRNSPYITLIIQVDPQIRSYLTTKKNGKIWLDKYYEVVDHFALKRCFTCGRLGHFKCRRTQPVCIRCGLHHQRRVCNAEKPKCTTCSGEHEAFTLECAKFRQAIDNEMDKIDYDYTDLMLGRCF